MKDDKRHINLEDNAHLMENPFGVERDYLKSLTEQIVNATQASESELEFNLHLKQNKMDVPSGYFDTLTNKIESRVLTEERTTKVVTLNSTVRFRWVGIAASLLLLASIYFGVSFSNDNLDELAEMSDESLIEFLGGNIELNEDLMADIADLDMILDEIYLDETSNLVGTFGDNPELEYDFDYYE